MVLSMLHMLPSHISHRALICQLTLTFTVWLKCITTLTSSTERHVTHPSAATWSVVTEDAGWGARGWFDVASLTKLSDPYSDVTPSLSSRTIAGNGPRMWLTGGGYMGQNGNSIVSTMIGYVDMWFSSDGSTWHQARGNFLRLCPVMGLDYWNHMKRRRGPPRTQSGLSDSLFCLARTMLVRALKGSPRRPCRSSIRFTGKIVIQ